MTLTMADSIYPADLPVGYDAYLGYVDGRWPTCAAIRLGHPGAKFVCLTVTGATTAADGIDIEPGNPDAAAGVAWLARALAAGVQRPVAYASVGYPGDGNPYSMNTLTGLLAAAGIPRPAVRLLAAHYDYNPHICGPASCAAISEPMDGTQWRNNAPGTGGTLIDESTLDDNFFAEDPMAVTVQTDIRPCTLCAALVNPNQPSFGCIKNTTIEVVNGVPTLNVGVHVLVGAPFSCLVLNDGTPVTG